MVIRRGVTRIGCLVPLLLLAIVMYVARPFAEAYFKYYQFADAMKQEARFSSARTDDAITARLRSLADSLDLPRDAGDIRINHTLAGVTIWSEYEITFPLPFNHEKTIDFRPSSGDNL